MNSRDTCLADLRPLELEDLPRFKEAVTAGEQQGWAFYFPFLLFVRRGRKKSRMLWTEDNGAICLFVLHTGTENRLDLYFPPFPADDGVLLRCLERANTFNNGHSARIYWIDQRDVDRLGTLKAVRLRSRNPQYLYRPRDLEDMTGSQYRNLRRNISLGQRSADIEVRPYELEDAPDCRRLLDHWDSTQGLNLSGTSYQRRYALYCIEIAPRFDHRDLHGLVFLIDGQVRAFAFGGEIRPELGCSLLAIADPDVVCLSYVMRHRFLTGMRDCLLVNDGSDGGQEGLQQMKERFRPCGLHLTFQGKQMGPLPSRISGARIDTGDELHGASGSPRFSPNREDMGEDDQQKKQKRASTPPPYPMARYELRPSRIVPGQVGLFTLVDFHEGDMVVAQSLFDESRLVSWKELAAMDPVTRSKLIHYCYKSEKGVHAPRDINHITIGYFINHSCDPSLKSNSKGDFTALRPVKAGEELTADLEKQMKKTYSEFLCTCGSKNCRKIVKI